VLVCIVQDLTPQSTVHEETAYVAAQRKAEYVVAQQREEMLAKHQAEAAKKTIYYD
jgi:hypothetical protein